MGTSPQAFNQVKNILQKLDRSIDDARTRRLTTPEERAQSLPPQAQPQQAAPFDPARAGRARPLARPMPRPGFG